ncbi:MAG: indole-3-glycerol phosphate synthase TrpC [Candidatus Competibacterales bacterium]
MTFSANPPDILQRILDHKYLEVAARRRRRSMASLRDAAAQTPPPRGFARRLEAAVAAGGWGVIAEIKRASPSKGLLRDPFDPAAIAKSYARSGATCLSVLTDEAFFQGHDTHLQMARQACDLPGLLKDFTVDPYQVWEARCLGADAVLLIAAALADGVLATLATLAAELELDVLLEVHDGAELARALALVPPPALVGINNRNLRTFETRLETTLDLVSQIPLATTLVTESGIQTPDDVALMERHGVRAFLIGEAFMRAEDPGERLAQLFLGRRA